MSVKCFDNEIACVSKVQATKSGGQNYNFIDVVKMICAALVVSIHVPPLGGVHWVLNFALVNYLARLAVPFFFVSSSYFLFLKAYDRTTGRLCLREDVILRYALRIFRLYVIWSIIYAPFRYYHMCQTIQDLTFWQFLRHYVKQFVFSSAYGHLWYLRATVVACLILLFLLKTKIETVWIVCFALIMYCMGLCAQSWFGFIEPLRQFPRFWSFLRLMHDIFETTRGGLCEGVLFMTIGMLFAQYNIRIKMKTAWFCLAGALILFAAEVFVLSRLEWIREYDMFFGMVPSVFFLFYVSLHIQLADGTVYRQMRKLSALVYFLHMLAVEMLLVVPKLQFFSNYSLAAYALVLAVSLAASWGIVKLSERFTVLRCLYR